jgi:6-phosphogluconolactonase
MTPKLLFAASLLFFTVSLSAENRFVYVNNQAQPNTVSAFKINANGSLSQLAKSPFLTGGVGAQGPLESMAIVPTTTHSVLYGANGGDPSVSILAINPTTGGLEPAANSPFLLNDSTGTYDIAASPGHKFLFVTNEASTVIHVLAIAPKTGALSELAGSPFAAGANIAGLWVTANGKFLLASGNSNNSVEVFAIAATGAITQVAGSPFAASGSVSDVRGDCDSDSVFAVSDSSDLVDAYKMSAGGALRPALGSPFYNGATGSGPNSFDLAISPNNKYLLTTDSFSFDITSFAIAADGALAEVPGSPFSDGASWLGGTAITNKGDFLYSIGFADGSIDARSVGTNGVLTAVPGTPFTDGQISQGGEINSVIAYPTPVCAVTAAQ